MPNYKFKCLKCGHEFQKLLPAGHKEQKCLECGHESQRQLEAPGVQFIGEGFYKTDSRKTEVKKEAPKSSEKNDKKK